ncbi:MAG: multicopper oxidase domain-containing protein [Gammaproteobacteria bacterium]|nr:multicopper oxidase domain-containing protein [Gammaproteobacteria bacterium]
MQASAVDVGKGITLSVRQINKTFGGETIAFWVYCSIGGTGPGSCANPQLPGPLLELGVGAQANITLKVPMMMASEPPPYHGHTIHFHGLDVSQSEDGVPETGASVFGDQYTFSVDSRYVGGHKYHCHVHTVKHLEMGMYGAFVVRDVDQQGNFLKNINAGGPAYDDEWNWVLSTVDPSYHTAVGDSLVFASYTPRYFLVNGKEGLSRSSPAETLTSRVNSTVAIRLMGLHSTNATFQILNTEGTTQDFVLHNMDGFALNTPKTLTQIEVSPGQTKDIMITLPVNPGTLYPEVTYRRLRDDSSYSTVYSILTFN